MVEVIEEEFEDGVELVGHLCYAIEVERCMYERCIVIVLTTRLGGQIRKVVAPIFGSVIVIVFSGIIGWFLPDDSIEWIEVEYLCLFLSRLEFLELDLYLYLGSMSDSSPTTMHQHPWREHSHLSESHDR